MNFDGVKFVGALQEHLETIIRPLSQRIKELESRCAEFEDGTKALNFADIHKGTYDPSAEYKRGDLLTHQGGVWMCLKDTTDRPGASPRWKLVIKSPKVREDSR